MFSHRFDQNPNSRVVLHWFMLSFNGGCINAGGFLATGKFVSHVTGFATLFGVDAMTGQVKLAISMLTVPIFFLLGAFMAGMMIERPMTRGKPPHFDWVMGISTICLFVTAAGHFWAFGGFGEIFRLKHAFILLALLCLASGLQNAAITASSLRSVRTTHLTGITTDLGLGLARLLTSRIQKKKTQDEIRSNKLRFGSILSFVLGSAAGAYIFIHLGYAGFCIPALITAYAAWHGRKAKANYGVAVP
jgi:uncharacterized membrane protein YoaK (UPF0700 family)